MKHYTPAPGIEVYETGVDLNKYFSTIFENKKVRTINEKRDKKDLVGFDLTSSIDTQLVKPFVDLISEQVNEYKEKYEIKVLYSHEIDFIQYQPGGHFDSHHDDDGYGRRQISFIFYVNDDYEGGEVDFHQFDYVLKPKKGMLVIFPSNYAYIHTAYPVLQGEKRLVLGFLSKYERKDWLIREFERENIRYDWGY
jgi:hypothetical protein